MTDDSDVFLFGARFVYKNIFLDSKYVEAYSTEDIKKELGLEREDMGKYSFFSSVQTCHTD